MQFLSVERYGNQILHRYVGDDGEVHHEKVPFEPTLFVSSNENTGWKTLKKKNVIPKRFDSINDARDFISQFKDIRPDVIHGISDFDLLFIHEKYHSDIKFDFSKIDVRYFDIECSVPDGVGFPDPRKADFPINAITVYSSKKGKYYTFSYVAENFQSKFKNSIYLGASSEREMLSAFVGWWEKEYCDILSGWNCVGFDIPYLINRLVKLFGEDFAKRLSPWNKISARETLNSFGQEMLTYNIMGIEVIDYIDAYKKFTIKAQESYKLGFIASVELGETKIEFDDSLYQLAKEDPQKFLSYNETDVELLVRMDKKLQLMFLVATLAYFMRVNFSDTLGTVRPWTSKIAYELFKRKTVIDAYHRPQGDTTFEAAFVKEPIKGKYKRIATFDATSLYPHMIMLSNISPDSKVDIPPKELESIFRTRLIELIERGEWSGSELLKKYNLTIAANGQLFTREKGILAELMEELFAMRKAKKKEMLSLKKEKEAKYDSLSPEEIDRYDSEIRALDVMQNSLKIALNSVFGATGNKHFPLFDLFIAEAITFNGQAGIRYVARKTSEYISRLIGVPGDYVIYIDTDSLAVNIEAIIEKFGLDGTNPEILIKLTDEKLSSVIEGFSNEYCQMLNGMWNALQFKREKVCSSGIYIAKKKYVLKVIDNEGVRYAHPEIAVTGLETNRSSTPKIVRDMLLKAYDIALEGTEKDVQKYVSTVFDEFKTIDYRTIAFPRGVNGINEYSDPKTVFKKGCPMHVRASLMFNHMLKKKGIDKKYQSISSGDKIKFIFLRPQNPTRENVIAYIDSLPEEFGLEPFIDYDMMFNKTFKEPLQNLLTVIGWNTEEVSTLSFLFGD